MPDNNPFDSAPFDVLLALTSLMGSPGRFGGPEPFPLPPANPLAHTNRNSLAQAAGQQFASTQGPALPQGSQPGFEFSLDLPMQRLLGQLPSNQITNILRAFTPAASVYTQARNPWDKPSEWGALFSLGKQW